MAFVLDASVTAAWLLPDEESLLAEHVQDLLVQHHAVVPTVWWFEIRNTLLVAERRNRLSEAQTHFIQDSLASLPILLDREPDERSLMEIARRNTLTVYDASYVESARRLVLPLATLDKAMARAALREQVDLVLNIDD
jgi:predicted nucleic acid-binding protein